MYKVLFNFLVLLFFANHLSFNDTINTTSFESPKADCQKLYADMRLGSIVNFKAFEQFIQGYQKINNIFKKDIVTLIDYSRPSTEKRFFIFDLKNRKILFSSLVAHGKNSGENYATSFSNQNGSNKSSLGFFVTENTYIGKNGYSLVLNGLEKGINDHAKERAIVIHGASYCNPSFITSVGRLGRSQGCPALPQNLNDTVINTIKGGTLLFIYANDQQYVQRSSFVN